MESSGTMAKTRSKRRKINQENSAYDPIAVFQEPQIQDLIFQHLPGATILNLFSVSKSWNAAASNSPMAMSKISLKIFESRVMPRKDVTTLLNSNRRYQKATFSFYRKSNIERKMMLLHRFSPSLVEINFIEHNVSTNIPSDLNFPKLHVLRVFTIHSFQSQSIYAFLKHKLTELAMFPQLNVSAFMQDPPTLYSSSLKVLSVFLCNKQQFKVIIEKFEALQSLKIEKLTFTEASEAELGTNQSITTFNFSGEMSNNVIGSMKNLKEVECISSDHISLSRVLLEGNNITKVDIVNWRGRMHPSAVFKLVELIGGANPSIHQVQYAMFNRNYS